MNSEQEKVFFETIDATFEEPVLVAARRAVREYNRLFAESPAEVNEQAESIIRELDSEVEAFIGAPIRVSGMIRFGDQEGRIIDQYVEDVDVIFNGYCIGSIEPVVETTTETPKQLYLHGYINEELQQGLAIAIDPFASIEFTQGMSQERASAFLEVTYLPILEEVNEVLFQEGLDDEAMIPLALKRIDMNLPGVHEGDMADVLSALQAHLNATVSFDQGVPYMCEFKGPCYVFTEDGTIQKGVMEKGERPVLARFNNFIIMTEGTEAQEGRPTVSLCVATELLLTGYEEPSLSVMMPVRSLKSAASLRRAYYSEQ